MESFQDWEISVSLFLLISNSKLYRKLYRKYYRKYYSIASLVVGRILAKSFMPS